jgi:hypothetical protein
MHAYQPSQCSPITHLSSSDVSVGIESFDAVAQVLGPIRRSSFGGEQKRQLPTSMGQRCYISGSTLQTTHEHRIGGIQSRSRNTPFYLCDQVTIVRAFSRVRRRCALPGLLC